MSVHDHEEVVYFRLVDVGLTAIVAIHNTTLGPALGGVRMWPYDSESAALNDALNLSRDMTYKAAAAGLRLGGGKSVIIGTVESERRADLFRAFGRCVESLNGRYIASEDVGTSVADIEVMATETQSVVGTDPARGGNGDPSPWTARGVFRGMEAALAFADGTIGWAGRRVAIQGVGKVGEALVRLVTEAGAGVVVADVDADKARLMRERFGAEVCAPEVIYDQACDIFAPCAMGGAIDKHTLSRLACRIIAGGANNQLADAALADALRGRNIVYVPDFVINAGGLINVASERESVDPAYVEREVDAIGGRVADLLVRADERQTTPLALARHDVHERLAKARNPGSSLRATIQRGAF